MIVKCRFRIQDQVAVAVDFMQNIRTFGQKFLYLTFLKVLIFDIWTKVLIFDIFLKFLKVLMPHHGLYLLQELVSIFFTI